MLPSNDHLRVELHNEVHARPQAQIHWPALIVYVAVANQGVTREQEHAHLRLLPGHCNLDVSKLSENFLRLRIGDYTVKWERHTEFTRYSIVQPFPLDVSLGADDLDQGPKACTPDGWVRTIPGRVIAAIEMAMVSVGGDSSDSFLNTAHAWLDAESLVASSVGHTREAWVATDFRLRSSGFERMLVGALSEMSPATAGRISQRLLELETYRLMALRGLPVAKKLGPILLSAEYALADITTNLEGKLVSDQVLLDMLISLAARVERETAQHIYRFSATKAYDALVIQRISELREAALPGSQTIAEFMQRRLSPAIATVVSTEQRLASLAERISRTSALLRTRVDIASEGQNQKLLEKLTRGQQLQLNLQTMVEGLSLAAISYYVVSLLLYCLKALKGIGVPMNPYLRAGAAIPFVMLALW